MFFSQANALPSKQGMFKILYKSNTGYTETFDTIEAFFDSEHYEKGGRLFITFEHDDTNAKKAARALELVAKVKGLSTRINPTGIIVYKDALRQQAIRAQFVLEHQPGGRKKKRKRKSSPLPESLRNRLRSFKKVSKAITKGRSIPSIRPRKKEPQKKSFLRRIMGR